MNTTVKKLNNGVLKDNVHYVRNGKWDNTYKVMIYNGTACYTVFQVNANCEQDALDATMDFCVANCFEGLYCDLWDIWDNEEEEEDYIHCGNEGLYFSNQSMVEKIERGTKNDN